MRGKSLGACFGLFLLSSCSSEASHQSLVGCGIDQVLEQLGQPVQTCKVRGGLTLGYRDEQGEVVADAVCMLGGVVVKYAPGLQRNATPSPDVLADRVEVVIEQLGPVRSLVSSDHASHIEWDQWEGVVYDGHVLAERKG